MSSPIIDDVQARVYVIPTDLPEADGTLTWDSTTMVMVRVKSGNSIGTGWTYGPAACASLVDDLLTPQVLDQDPMNLPALSHSMIRAVCNASRAGLVSYAISAVDTALWDLKARLLDLPLHRLLGEVTADVPVYGSGGFTTYTFHQMEKQLARWTQELGIPRAKIKIGEAWGRETDRDLRRMESARKTIKDADLMVDANGAYSQAEAIRIMEEAHDLDVTWFEEPVSSDDVAGLRAVRAAVLPDVTAGEYGTDIFYFRGMCEANAIDCLQVDVSRCGGISEWQRIAALAAAHNLQVSGHCAPHLHAHVAASTPNFRHLEWFHDHVRIENMVFDGTLDPQGGGIHPCPEAPGTGLILRENDVEAYRQR